MNEGQLAENVRRLAGMHLVSMERLSEVVGISRPSMQAIVAYDLTTRSKPKTETAMKIADAFGVTLNALYQEPEVCLREALERFREAPIAKIADPPPAELRPVERRKGVVTPFDRTRKGGRRP